MAATVGDAGSVPPALVAMKEVAQLVGHEGGVMAVRFNRKLCRGARRQPRSLRHAPSSINITAATRISPLRSHLAFFPSVCKGNGQYCLTGGRDKLVKLWNPLTQLCIKTYKGHSSEVNDIAA